jgi:hypothetical protein
MDLALNQFFTLLEKQQTNEYLLQHGSSLQEQTEPEYSIEGVYSILHQMDEQIALLQNDMK